MTTPYAPYQPPAREGRGWRVAPIQIGFTLSVTPALSPMGGYHGTATEMLVVTPALGMDEVGHSLADLTLAFTPAIGMDDPFGALALTVTPALMFSGAEHYSSNAGLDVSASVGFGMGAVGPTWVADFPLTVTPALVFTGAPGLNRAAKNPIISQSVRRSSLY